jgi:endogenous inhibitor of DNA gyrase (YacG/DUF329 family)
VSHQRAPRSEPVACPICGRPLKWVPDRWLAAFECEHCGQFSDFGGAALPSEERHRWQQLSLPYESARAESPDTERDETMPGTAA